MEALVEATGGQASVEAVSNLGQCSDGVANQVHAANSTYRHTRTTSRSGSRRVLDAMQHCFLVIPTPSWFVCLFRALAFWIYAASPIEPASHITIIPVGITDQVQWTLIVDSIIVASSLLCACRHSPWMNRRRINSFTYNKKLWDQGGRRCALLVTPLVSRLEVSLRAQSCTLPEPANLPHDFVSRLWHIRSRDIATPEFH